MSSTFLTLFVIPSVYSLFDGLKMRFHRDDPDATPTPEGQLSPV